MTNLPAKDIATFAENNGICVRTVYHEISEGRLRARKVGRRTIILPEDEAEWRHNLEAMTPSKVA
jgi:hypothetical protein